MQDARQTRQSEARARRGVAPVQSVERVFQIIDAALPAALPQSQPKWLLSRIKLEPKMPNTARPPRKSCRSASDPPPRVDDIENEESVRYVEAAILGHDGQVVAVIGASGAVLQLPLDEVPRRGHLSCRRIRCPGRGR
ncbi:MAG: hypothetical protein AB1609_06510 [Bacillota bacterium]